MAGSDLLGTMIETFVIAQPAAQAAVSGTRYRPTSSPPARPSPDSTSLGT